MAAPGAQAAIYGALCGHVARVLPVCRGWEDTAWAFVRCWLEIAVDDALGVLRSYNDLGDLGDLGNGGCHYNATIKNRRKEK